MAQGRQLLGQQRYAEAEAVFRSVTETQPQHAGAWYFLGYSLHAQQKLEAALEAHLKAAEFPQVKPNALYNAACASSLLGKTEQAYAQLEQAVASGFGNRGLLQTDADLENLRKVRSLEKLLPPLRKGADAFREAPRVIYELEGEASQDEFGWVGRRLGDLDGDGVLDFATSSPGKVLGGPHAGRVYVYSGRAGKLLYQWDGSPGQRFGNGIGRTGDVNEDGVPDVCVGAPSGGPGIGRAFLYSGKDGERLFEFTAGESGDSFGIKVSGAGDVDGDGRMDLVVGAIGADAAGQDAGRCYFYSGATGKLIATLEGEKAGDNFGSAVDASMDEHHLVAIGAMNAGPNQQGRVYVYRFAEGQPKLLFKVDADATGGSLGQYFVAIAGDVDADGTPDVFATDFTNTAAGAHTGRAYVYSGRDGSTLLTLTGKQGEGFGTSVSQADDVNGDGHADFIIGAWQNAEGAPSGGKCYLHSGKDGSVLATYTGLQAQDTLGFDAQGLGDVDGDGRIDFLLTSAWSEVHGPKTGRVFLIAGSVPE